MAEWDWEANNSNNFYPYEVTLGNNYLKVYWTCTEGHKWQATVANRNNGTGCPYCANRKVLKGFNDLQTLNPSLAAEWNYDKNSSLTPSLVPLNSSKKVWWKCFKGHEWQALVKSRNSGRGCPICAGKIIHEGFNDLASKYPLISAEWHPTKNGELTPENTAAKSNKKVWWLCANGHEWETKIEDRTRGAGCPFCSHRRVESGKTDLQSVYPLLTEEWHPTKNGALTPSAVSSKSAKVVWWLGKCGHSWQASIGNRSNGTGCPVCWSESASSFPEQAIFFYCKQITTAQNRCVVFGKEIDIYLPNFHIGIEHNGYYHRDRNRDIEKIRFFKEHNIRIISIYGDNNYRSNTLDGDIIQYVYSSANTNGLIWAINCLFKLIGLDAPNVNIDKDRTVIMDQYILSKKENSLQVKFPQIAKEWHPTKNGTLTADMFAFGSRKKMWWLASCGHEWEATILSRTSGRGCPICAGKIIVSGENDLLTHFPEISKQWHPSKNGFLLPQNVSGNSHKKVWWLGACGHEWEAQIKSRAHGAGCPICSGAKILKGYNDLATLFPHLANEWHPTKNLDLTPTQVSGGSERKVWWLGCCGHEWQAIIKNRKNGANCPICAKEKQRSKK